jgi:hypothetical protein
LCGVQKGKEKKETTPLHTAHSDGRGLGVVWWWWLFLSSFVSFHLSPFFFFCLSFELLELETRKQQRRIKRIKRTKKDTTPLHTAHFGRTWSRCRVAVVIVSIFVLLYLVHSSFFSSLILNH